MFDRFLNFMIEISILKMVEKSIPNETWFSGGNATAVYFNG
jgi:hypothetical protein